MKPTFAIVLLFAAGSVSGQSASIDTLLTRMTREGRFSGAVLIARNDEVLLEKGYGYANREKKVRNTASMRFPLSSASKVFTGTAITWLAQQGKLRFTDTVGAYIKGLPKGNIITIHQVLTHAAGFDDFFKAKNFSYANVKNCTDMLPFMRSLPLVFNPGDSAVYSTGNLIVLGAIIEQITGMSYQDYITRWLIKPLGLNNTSFTPYWSLDNTQRQYAVGYTEGFKPRAYNYDNGSVPLSAGGAWTSVRDLFTFDRAVFTGKLLDAPHLALMTARYTPQWESSFFGYTWITLANPKGYYSIGHDGDSSGWHAVNQYYPEQGYTIILLTNFGFVDLAAIQQKIEEILNF